MHDDYDDSDINSHNNLHDPLNGLSYVKINREAPEKIWGFFWRNLSSQSLDL